MFSFRILTFGCKVNQCDSQVIRETLAAWGLAEADTGQADLVVINTCTVTGGADAKFKKALRKVRRENEHALVAVTGCFAARAQDSSEAVPHPFEKGNQRGDSALGADVVFSSKNLAPLAQFLRERRILSEEPPAELPEQSYFAEHTRAFLKIQDGCDCFCSYCIVPFVRPKLWSRRPEDVVATINRLSAAGYKEVVLTGIHLAFYGRDRDEKGLTRLLPLIEENCDIKRLRLSSMEVNEISDEMVELMAQSSKICRHLHLPLQSGDSEILGRMNRRYTVEFFLERVEEIRKKIPDIGITTDVIVGFPGETEEQFERTCQIIQELECAKIHVFRYSRRPGTRATAFDSPVQPNEISRRARRLIRVGNDAAVRYKRRFVGQKLEVLVETYDSKRKACEGFAPNYIRVQAKNPPDHCMNMVLPLRITGVDADAGVAIGIWQN